MLDPELSLSKSFEMLTSAKTNVGILTGIEVRDGCFHRIQPAYHLMNIARSVWIVKACNNKIASEVTKFGWDFLPNFTFKCIDCDMEYDHKPENMTCECGSNRLREPDSTQLRRVKALFEKPNFDITGAYVRKPMKEMLKDSTVYLLSIADWYWTIHKDENGVPTALDICPSEYIKECVPETIYFCPICAGDRVFNTSKNAKGDKCKKHSLPLIEAGYVQTDERNRTLMAWRRDDILHGQVDAYGNRKVGESRLMALIKECQTINWTGMYIWSSLSMSKRPGKIAAFPGMSQEDVNKMLAAIYKFKAEHPEIQRDLWLGTPNEAPTILDMMGEMSDASLTALRTVIAEEIALTYGISMSFLGKPVAGKLGNPEDLMSASTATVCEVQQGLGSFVNNQVMSQFNEVTDWRFELTPPTKEDKQADATWRLMQAQTLRELRGAQMDAILNDDFEIVIRGELPMTPVAPQMGAQPAPSLPGSSANILGQQEPPALSAREQIRQWLDDEDDEGEDAESVRKCGCQKAAVCPRCGGTNTGTVISDKGAPTGQYACADCNILFGSTSTTGQPYGIEQKSLTPRNNPDNVRGLTNVEKDYDAKYDAVLKASIKALADGKDRKEVEAGTEQALRKIGREYAMDIYKMSHDAEAKAMGTIALSFEQPDENALEYLLTTKDGLYDAIKTQSAEVIGKLHDEMLRMYSEEKGMGLNRAVENLQAYAKGQESWKLERIVRSETTKISNEGRARHWEKANPDGMYEWSVSHSPGRPPCKACEAIANRGAMTLKELRTATKDFLPHPNCHCAAVRVTSLSGGA